MKTYSFELSSIESTVTFRESASSVLDEDTEGPCLPSDWDKFVVFADEDFDVGSAWYCLNKENNAIYRIDIELEKPIEYINSCLDAFEKSILETVKWSQKYGDKVEGHPEYANYMEEELAKIDPIAFESKNYFWPGLINHIQICASVIDEDYEQIFRFEIT